MNLHPSLQFWLWVSQISVFPQPEKTPKQKKKTYCVAFLPNTRSPKTSNLEKVCMEKTFISFLKKKWFPHQKKTRFETRSPKTKGNGGETGPHPSPCHPAIRRFPGGLSTPRPATRKSGELQSSRAGVDGGPGLVGWLVQGLDIFRHPKRAAFWLSWGKPGISKSQVFDHLCLFWGGASDCFKLMFSLS